MEKVRDYTIKTNADGLKTASRWVPITEENILMYDMPGRSGMDRNVLLWEMDQAYRRGDVLYMYIEDVIEEGDEASNPTASPAEGSR